jgi:ferredoxin
MEYYAMITLTVETEQGNVVLSVEKGANLRDVLLANGFNPYTPITRRLNCGGRGICATCGVWVEGSALAPQHWHDKLADGFGYPRLSCQITLDTDLTIRLVADKKVWGGRDARRATWFGGSGA